MCVRTAMMLGRSSARAAVDGGLDGVQVVAVGDALGVPAVGVEAGQDVLATRPCAVGPSSWMSLSS